MSESLITKKALAVSMKQLMGKMPLAKISIKDIVNTCGVNRKTFYYHFKDKYDLINWIYYTEVTDSIADCNHYDNWFEGTCRTLTYLQENKFFYKNALNTHGQNAFEEYFFEFCFGIVMGAVNDLSSDMHIPDSNKNFIADFYTHAFVSITTEWIKNGANESPNTIVDGIRNIIEGSMPHALQHYSEDIN